MLGAQGARHNNKPGENNRLGGGTLRDARWSRDAAGYKKSPRKGRVPGGQRTPFRFRGELIGGQPPLPASVAPNIVLCGVVPCYLRLMASLPNRTRYEPQRHTMHAPDAGSSTPPVTRFGIPNAACLG